MKNDYCSESELCKTCIHVSPLANTSLERAIQGGTIFCAYILDTGHSRPKGSGTVHDCKVYSRGVPKDRRTNIVVKEGSETAWREESNLSRKDLKWLAGLMEE